MRKNSRKNKMNTAKLGVIFIVAAMALAGVGAGYAAWFDTITIQGTVNTGSVGWDVTEYSGTWVWKVYNAGDTGNGAETVVTHDRDETYSEDEGFLVASSYAEQTMTGDTDPVAVDDSVTVVFNNLFPCIDFEADFTVHYTGSVPGKINSITFRDLWPDTANEILIDKYTTLEVTIGKQDAAGTYHWTSLPIDQLDGYQLHYCNLIRVVMTIHLPQIDDNGEPTDYLMDLTGSFDLDVEVVQWNEYPYDGGECGEEPSIGHHADVALCLDTSGSVTGTPLADLKTASKAFVNVLVNDDGMVAIASFAALGHPVIALTDDQTALNTSIDDLTAGGLTNPGAGIIIAQDYLDNEPTTPDDRTVDATYPDFMVIITDGDPTTGGDDAWHIAQATAAKAAGTKIYVLGIGSVDATFCEALSSGTGYYFAMTNYGDLQTILLNLVVL